MHRPRDDFERELYDDRSLRRRRRSPVWQLLGLATATFLVAGGLVVFVRTAGVSGADLESLVIFGGLLLTVGSGLLAGLALIVVSRRLERTYRRWHRS